MPRPATALKADPPPAKVKEKEYDLRVIRLGKGLAAIRYKVATGETWGLSGEKYDKLPESGVVPAGDYEVTLLTTDDTNFLAWRIDRQSGATWQLTDGKWVKVKEPE
jgi:hypothetical protein